jgi:hypothetical protein
MITAGDNGAVIINYTDSTTDCVLSALHDALKNAI